MVSLLPIVIDIRHAREFLQFVLENHAPPSTLIVCSSKGNFLKSFQPADISDLDVDRAHEAEEEQHAREGIVGEQAKHFAPTLRLLSTSRTVKLAFCSDVTHLRAYLACFTTDGSSGPVEDHEPDGNLFAHDAVPVLAILNPIELHRPTSAFSAQGINRTLSVAIEAAFTNGRKLILAETTFEAWTEELPILNVTNRRLGELSVGRTVTAKAVAERWCTFEKHVSSGS